jgi:hypothetical protein
MALEFNGQIPVEQNPFLMFSGDRAFFNPRETHYARSSFIAGLPLCLKVQASR